jgi:protein ImuB
MEASAKRRRILALWLPRLSTDRLTRLIASPKAASHKESLAPETPLVVAGRANNALYVHALNVAASRQGIYRGQPLANARAMIQNLRIVPADEKADADLLEGIADWCDRFTPLVALDAPHGLLLDITGVAHLFGGEEKVLAMVRAKIAAQGFAVQGAIAGTCLAARALARHAKNTIAPPGENARLLAPLPVAALDCGEDIMRAFRRAGLKTIAQVAERGRAELASRFGGGFVTCLDMMLGAEEKPLTPRRPLPDFRVEQRFAEPVITKDVIAASLHALAVSLSGMLERDGQGLRHLEAFFFRADGKVERIAVRTGAPLRDADVMLRLLNERLEALADPLDPGFGFDVIRLEASLTEKNRIVTASFDDNENSRWQIAFLVDRLAARFGEHRVQRFVAQDTHIPEAQSVAIPAQDRDFDGTWVRRRKDNDPPLRPLRLLEKPEEISVPVSNVPKGAPLRFRWRRAQFDVTRVEGPERIAMEWWKKENPTRDYFRVETRDGQRFWLYRDGTNPSLHPQWYLQGIFA